MLDQLRAERPHGGVLLTRVATRRDGGDSEVQAPPGEREALSVIAARRRDQARDPRLAAQERLHVGQATAHLERADRLMVFVLDDDFGAEARREQRPGDGRRRPAWPPARPRAPFASLGLNITPP